jgi:hypothetical protein
MLFISVVLVPSDTYALHCTYILDTSVRILTITFWYRSWRVTELRILIRILLFLQRHSN